MNFDVVIAGGGFAGVYAARALARKLGVSARSRVALLADRNFMTFQPMLAEVAGSSLSPRHVVNPLRRLCRDVTVLRGEINDISVKENRLELTAGHFTRGVQIGFDHLVFALGGTVDLSRVPGMPEHAYLMKNVGDAQLLRAAVIDRLEEANFHADEAVIRRLLTFVVVGGGYSGVETAGQLNDLIQGVYRFYPRLRQFGFKVVLIHSRAHLLPEVSESLGAYCESDLRSRGVEVMLEERVNAVTASKVFLQSGRIIESNTVVSTVGNAPHPLIVRLSERGTISCERGRIQTGPDMRVLNQEKLWAAGDCAAVPKAGGGNCPPTAQFALRQGTLLGKNVAAVLEGGDTKPFTFTGLGELASIGHRAAVAEILGMKFSGFIAWFMWRGIYLSKLPGLERKVRVMIDWTLDLFFPRDITLLEPQPTEILQEVHLEKGDHVFHAGDPALSFYIVKSGRIDILDSNGIVKTMKSGEHFGERALLSDKVWRFHAVAVEPSTLVSISGKTFEAISRASHSINAFFRRSSSQYINREELSKLMEGLPEGVKHKKVGELMSRDVVTMRPNMTIADALRVMTRHPYNSFPLTTEDGEILGLLSQNEVYDALKRMDINRESTLKAVPTGTFATVLTDTAVPEALERFFRSGRNKLLVVDCEARLRGILTPIDLLSADQPDNS